MCLSVINEGHAQVAMSMNRSATESWTLKSLGANRTHTVQAHDGAWLATKDNTEKPLFMSYSMCEGARWELIPVFGEADRFFLKSIHGKSLASLNSQSQTVYMSPGQKDWEKWIISPIKGGLPVNTETKPCLTAAPGYVSGTAQEAPHATAKDTAAPLLEPASRLLLPDDKDSTKMHPIEEVLRKLLDRKPRKVLSKDRLVLVKHHYPEKPLMYGRWFGMYRAPVVFLEAPCKAVAEYLRSDPLGPWVCLSDIPLQIPLPPAYNHWNFEATIEESVVRADWHAVPHLGDEAEVFVPRLAKQGRLLRAPPRVTAFVMALRAVNQPCWNAVVDALTALKLSREQQDAEYKLDGRGSLLGTFIECFRNNRHFGVVEAQMLWGDNVPRQKSHMDGATSLLHIGLTLGGRRTLRVGVFSTQREESSGTSVWDEATWAPQHLHEMSMSPGSIYISSPFCFEHAVAYSSCTPEDPILALMLRFAFPAQLGTLINNMRNDDMLDITTVIANCLEMATNRGQFRLPSLAEVKAGERRLAALDQDRARLSSG